jgi:hypothetical protein
MRSPARVLIAALCLLSLVAPAAAAPTAGTEAGPCLGVEWQANRSPAATAASAPVPSATAGDVEPMGAWLGNDEEVRMTPVGDAFRACLPTSVCCTCPQCCFDAAPAPTGLVG